jgi:hypothetical protein
MIGLPFLIWLLFALLDFGKIDQLFALLAVSGLVLVFWNMSKNRTGKILFIDFVCFILLASPIIGRLTAVPLSLFNYGAFIVPTLIFVLCYVISLIYSCSQYLAYKR